MHARAVHVVWARVTQRGLRFVPKRKLMREVGKIVEAVLLLVLVVVVV